MKNYGGHWNAIILSIKITKTKIDINININIISLVQRNKIIFANMSDINFIIVSIIFIFTLLLN